MDERSVEDLGFAGRANEAIADSSNGVALQDNSLVAGEAGLADVVGRFIAAWRIGPGEVLAQLPLQRKAAFAEFDQRVVAALIEGCLQFQVFLLHLGQVRLDLQESGVVREQTLLSLEKLIQQGGSLFVDERLISESSHPLGNAHRDGD